MVAGEVKNILKFFVIKNPLTVTVIIIKVSYINGEQAALFNKMDSKCGALRGSILKGDAGSPFRMTTH